MKPSADSALMFVVICRTRSDVAPVECVDFAHLVLTMFVCLSMSFCLQHSLLLCAHLPHVVEAAW